jgi:pimeloyl-ACP methyl ester carboxylesterase
MYGADSWASNPEKDGRAVHFKQARIITFQDAAHWLHHDQYDKFVSELQAFL